LEEEIQFAILSIVDLAGSEKAIYSNNMYESSKINQSLLVLSKCISELSKQKNIHIPYRNSKLTRLLKNSLGGNCKTIMIANISQLPQNYEDTFNTLTYASHAKKIKLNLIQNSLKTSKHIANYTQIIKNLKSQNEELKKIL
jgi:kinesin family protein 18/19